MSQSIRGGARPTLLCLALAAAFGVAANPVGPSVAAGQVAIQAGPGLTTVTQQSQRAIVNWQAFSIQPGEVTRFVQPSAGAAILNRVTGADPSRLLGTLQANGQVFLLNPNGILVGQGATIHTGAFVASTRDVSNSQFLHGGPLEFLGTSGASVTNLGTIRADSGDVALIAHTVTNAGSIAAPNGVAALASGTSVLLAPGATERVLVRPQAAAVGGEVVNTGTLQAAQVELRAAGGNPYALAVNAGGSLSALRVDDVGGRVFISAGDGTARVDGHVSARAGHHGGHIQVTGQQVHVGGTARLDAAGAAGGGAVLVGGDWQGANARVPNARDTIVEAGAVLTADATQAGDGGKVVVWADGSTGFEGSISARGGAQGGDGGQVEVSGKQQLAYAGRADLRAPRGRTGTLLLDPTDITIVEGPDGGRGIVVRGDISTITSGTVQAALDLANVVISTNSTGEADGNITVARGVTTPLVLNSANMLTLEAARDILLDENVLNLGGGELRFHAGRNVILNSGTFGPGLVTAKRVTIVTDRADMSRATDSGFLSAMPGSAICADVARLFVPTESHLNWGGNGLAFTSFSSNTPYTPPRADGTPETASSTSSGIYFTRNGTSAAGNAGGGNATVPGTGLTPGQTTVAPAVITPVAYEDPRITAALNSGDAELIRLAEGIKQLQSMKARGYTDPAIDRQIAVLYEKMDASHMNGFLTELAEIATRLVPGGMLERGLRGLLKIYAPGKEPPASFGISTFHVSGVRNVAEFFLKDTILKVDFERQTLVNTRLTPARNDLARAQEDLARLKARQAELAARSPGVGMDAFFGDGLANRGSEHFRLTDIANAITEAEARVANAQSRIAAAERADAELARAASMLERVGSDLSTISNRSNPFTIVLAP